MRDNQITTTKGHLRLYAGTKVMCDLLRRQYGSSVDVIQTTMIPTMPEKHIPIECWSEIDEYFTPTYRLPNIRVEGEIRNSGGRTYLVTKQTK